MIEFCNLATLVRFLIFLMRVHQLLLDLYSMCI